MFKNYEFGFFYEIYFPKCNNVVSEALVWDRGNECFWGNIFIFGKIKLIEKIEFINFKHDIRTFQRKLNLKH